MGGGGSKTRSFVCPALQPCRRKDGGGCCKRSASLPCCFQPIKQVRWVNKSSCVKAMASSAQRCAPRSSHVRQIPAASWIQYWVSCHRVRQLCLSVRRQLKQVV